MAEARVRCEGYLGLKKKRGVEERYFVLYKEDDLHYLMYFMDKQGHDDDAEPRGRINLDEVQSFERFDGGFSLEIEGKTVEFASLPGDNGGADVHTWIGLIDRIISEAGGFEGDAGDEEAAEPADRDLGQEVSQTAPSQGLGGMLSRSMTWAQDKLKGRRDRQEQGLKGKPTEAAGEEPTEPTEALCHGVLSALRKGKSHQRYFALFPDSLKYYASLADLEAGVEGREVVRVETVKGFQELKDGFSVVMRDEDGNLIEPMTFTASQDLSTWLDCWRTVLSDQADRSWQQLSDENGELGQTEEAGVDDAGTSPRGTRSSVPRSMERLGSLPMEERANGKRAFNSMPSAQGESLSSLSSPALSPRLTQLAAPQQRKVGASFASPPESGVNLTKEVRDAFHATLRPDHERPESAPEDQPEWTLRDPKPPSPRPPSPRASSLKPSSPRYQAGSRRSSPAGSASSSRVSSPRLSPPASRQTRATMQSVSTMGAPVAAMPSFPASLRPSATATPRAAELNRPSSAREPSSSRGPSSARGPTQPAELPELPNWLRTEEALAHGRLLMEGLGLSNAEVYCALMPNRLLYSHVDPSAWTSAEPEGKLALLGVQSVDVSDDGFTMFLKSPEDELWNESQSEADGVKVHFRVNSEPPASPRRPGSPRGRLAKMDTQQLRTAREVERDLLMWEEALGNVDWDALPEVDKPASFGSFLHPGKAVANVSPTGPSGAEKRLFEAKPTLEGMRKSLLPALKHEGWLGLHASGTLQWRYCMLFGDCLDCWNDRQSAIIGEFHGREPPIVRVPISSSQTVEVVESGFLLKGSSMFGAHVGQDPTSLGRWSQMLSQCVSEARNRGLSTPRTGASTPKSAPVRSASARGLPQSLSPRRGTRTPPPSQGALPARRRSASWVPRVAMLKHPSHDRRRASVIMDVSKHDETGRESPWCSGRHNKAFEDGPKCGARAAGAKRNMRVGVGNHLAILHGERARLMTPSKQVRAGVATDASVDRKTGLLGKVNERVANHLTRDVRLDGQMHSKITGSERILQPRKEVGHVEWTKAQHAPAIVDRGLDGSGSVRVSPKVQQALPSSR